MDGNKSLTLFQGLGTYLLTKRYNQCFGDLVPSISANALNMNIRNGNIQNIEIVPEARPGRTPPRSIFLHRKGEHYNGVAFTPAIMAPPNHLETIMQDMNLSIIINELAQVLNFDQSHSPSPKVLILTLVLLG